jgi:hypothetical protein
MKQKKEERKKKMQTHLYQPGKRRPPPLCSAFYHGFARVARRESKSGEVRFGLPVFGRAIILIRPAGEICDVYWRGNGHGDGGETGMRDEDEGRYVQVLVRNARDHGHAV